MHGLMMDFPLLLPTLLERAEALYRHQEVVTRLPDRSVHRCTLGDVVERSRRLAVALRALGIQQGDRVGTLGWNHYQHLEAYLGIPSSGGVLHTLNFRLHADDLTYIINHANDRVILVDRVLLPLLEPIRDRISAERIVVMTQGAAPDGDGDGDLPDGMLDYETMLDAVDVESYEPPKLDENDAAALCYTSGTTGQPKGALYSHRSMMLHSIVGAMHDMLRLSESSVYLPVVPMFHVNAWGTPYSCLLVGARLVFPGPHLDPESLCDLMARERVTMTAGVPTIWMGILALLDADPEAFDLGSLGEMLVGGSAASPALITGLERHGLNVVHAWGMTETSPLGTLSRPGPRHAELDDEALLSIRAKQGRMAPLVEIRARGDDGFVPWDDGTMGELEVRGPWVASAYFDSEQGSENFTEDGWFRTGDIVTIDPEGYVTITDRSKDVIKSGGEWISSIALENAIMGHPSITEAAIIPVHHPTWMERPLAIVVPVEGVTITLEEIREFLAPHFAKWWLPDAMEIVDAIPRTSTGKFRKRTLRERFAEYALPEDAPTSGADET